MNDVDPLQDLQVVGLRVRTGLVAALGQAGTTGTRPALMTPPSPMQLCTYHVQETSQQMPLALLSVGAGRSPGGAASSGDAPQDEELLARWSSPSAATQLCDCSCAPSVGRRPDRAGEHHGTSSYTCKMQQAPISYSEAGKSSQRTCPLPEEGLSVLQQPARSCPGSNQRRRSHQHLVAPAAGEHRPLVRLRRSVKPGGLQARPRTNLGWRSSFSSERDATAPAHSVGHTDPNPAVIAHQARQDQKGVKRGNRGAALKPPRFSAAEGLGSASAALLPPFTSMFICTVEGCLCCDTTRDVSKFGHGTLLRHLQGTGTDLIAERSRIRCTRAPPAPTSPAAPHTCLPHTESCWCVLRRTHTSHF
ncbi:hypothetical protein Anapl_18045 [Anas platyrhynchos]|uniref:Uncharacterized protein n=1 Tax=Anas platyrhynchos TaxID=8839 RepID=R0KW48_ANAPL|nr:hypothetical protein Anapl_18045 [Anas platyrhynchos]